MASVRCPGCGRRLEAADGDILSAALATHFVREHGLVLDDPQLLKGGREGHLSSEAEIEPTTGQKEVRGGSAVYGAGLTQRGEDLFGAEKPPQLAHDVPVEDFVECPLCGFRAEGRNENELSERLREHMASIGELEAIMQAPRRSK